MVDIKYSLWLIPDKENQQILQEIIDKLAEKYAAPRFEPHLTLLSSIPKSEEVVVEKTKEVAARTEWFTVTTGEIEFSTTYFQCVFVRIKTTIPLMETHVRTRDIFGMDKEKFFMPHISLLYGDYNMTTREKVCRAIELPEIAFTAERIVVVQEVPDPQVWQHLAEIPLRAN